MFCLLELHPKESAMILKLSRTLKLPLLLFILTFLVSLNVYFLLNVYLNDVYDRNWRSVFWWLIVFPVFLFYLLYGTAFNLDNHFIIISTKLSFFSKLSSLRADHAHHPLRAVHSRQAEDTAGGADQAERLTGRPLSDHSTQPCKRLSQQVPKRVHPVIIKSSRINSLQHSS